MTPPFVFYFLLFFFVSFLFLLSFLLFYIRFLCTRSINRYIVSSLVVLRHIFCFEPSHNFLLYYCFPDKIITYPITSFLRLLYYVIFFALNLLITFCFTAVFLIKLLRVRLRHFCAI